jgi:chorismate mutase/prephenate dehydratase
MSVRHKTQVVGYLGPEGTFSETAARAYFESSAVDVQQYKSWRSIKEVFHAVEQQQCDIGVVPVENSSEGAVNATQDCLVDSDLQIVGEIILPISQNLLVSIDYPNSSISRIVSHKQSLAQCRDWLKKYYPQATLEECESNSIAAEIASSNKGVGVIAGPGVAEPYRLKIKSENIQDFSHNSTRFLLLSGEECIEFPHAQQDFKTSLVLRSENKPGALYEILGPFAAFGVDLVRLESRPSKTVAWEYIFFIDFVGEYQVLERSGLFSQLEPVTTDLKCLGSYVTLFDGRPN